VFNMKCNLKVYIHGHNATYVKHRRYSNYA